MDFSALVVMGFVEKLVRGCFSSGNSDFSMASGSGDDKAVVLDDSGFARGSADVEHGLGVEPAARGVFLRPT